MTRFSKALLISIISTTVSYQSLAYAEQIKTLEASQIKPTQPAIGGDEVKYKVATFTADRHKLFDNFCKDNGAKGVKSFSITSNISQADSFTCLEPQGTQASDIKSAVIAPDHRVYLTDGHHTLSTFRAISANQPFQFSVRITEDLSGLPTMDAFWQKMQQQSLTWLVDANGNTISPSQLPQQIGLDWMQDDQYRSVVYFLRGIAYDKPENAPPFLEFYLGSWLRENHPITPQLLTTKQGYLDYLSTAAKALVTAEGSQHSTNDPNSPTLAQLGQRETVNLKKLGKLVSPTGKLSVLFAH